MDKSLKKEVTLYSIIAVILIVISILNNVFWKFGKGDNISKTQDNQQLEINNITYNVPFDEKWLD